MKSDERWMGECLRMARLGRGTVRPNPLVGAVLVKKGRLLAAGAHRVFGGPHAEADCLTRFNGDPRGATMYVNLEPCNHTGKTGPCTERIIAAGIRRVVVGMLDPNPLVHGKGVRRLRRNGVSVTVGVLEHECREINEPFATWVTTGRPYLHVKIASGVDGRLAGKQRWISSATSRRLVHRWRAAHDAVLVGAGTVCSDNPRLTVRGITGRNPSAVVIDGDFRSPVDSLVFNDRSPARAFLCLYRDTAERKRRKVEILKERGVSILTFRRTVSGIPFGTLLRALARQGLTSILAEAGPDLSGRLVASRYVHRLSVFVAPTVTGGDAHGFRSSVLRSERFRLTSISMSGPDLLLSYVNDART